MDINQQRLVESLVMVNKIVSTLGASAEITVHTHQRNALDGADFVIVTFQVGGYDPCTITDFEIQKNMDCAKRWKQARYTICRARQCNNDNLIENLPNGCAVEVAC